jgi:hypothetical protein
VHPVSGGAQCAFDLFTEIVALSSAMGIVLIQTKGVILTPLKYLIFGGSRGRNPDLDGRFEAANLALPAVAIGHQRLSGSFIATSAID